MVKRIGVIVLAAGCGLAADQGGWKPLFNGKDLNGWEVRGECKWSVMPEGVLVGQRVHAKPADPFGAWPVTQSQYRSWLYRQAWIYTKAEYENFDLHLEYWLPAGGNGGVSIRDRSRAHHAIGELDSARPELAQFPKTTPANIGYEIQIVDGEEKYQTGSIYRLVAAEGGAQRIGEWNSLDIESRPDAIRVRVNGKLVAEGPGDPQRSKTGPIGLQLHDQFSFMAFRNIRIRQR